MQVLASTGSRWFGRATTKVLDDGTSVLIYREASAHNVNDGNLHIRFSGDYGETWTAQDMFMNSGSVTGFPMNPPAIANMDSGEPWLYVAPNNDLILHMWNIDYDGSLSGTWQSMSSDNGETWSIPATIVNFSGITGSNFRVFATEDNFNLSGTMYAGARAYKTTDAGTDTTDLYLIKSADNGNTWEKISTICAGNEGLSGKGSFEVGLEYIGNNTIIATMRGVEENEAYQRFSTDMGETWGALELLSSNNPMGLVGRTRIYTRAHLKGEAEWWNDSVLLVVGFLHSRKGNSLYRYNAIWISLDKGVTWSRPYLLDALYDDGGYADMFYNPNTDQYVVVSYRGTLDIANVIQYNLRIVGI